MSLRPILASLALPLLVLAAAPAAFAADLCRDVALQCGGFEPNWNFTVGMDDEGDQVLSFTDPENPDWQTAPLVVEACVLAISPDELRITSAGPLDLDAQLLSETCVEPNDEEQPISIKASFNQGAQTSSPNQVSGTGCCKLLP
jgi:hypothetical protein